MSDENENRCTADMFKGMELLHARAEEMQPLIPNLLNEMHGVIVRGRLAVRQGKDADAWKRYGEAEGLWVAICRLARRLGGEA